MKRVFVVLIAAVVLIGLIGSTGFAAKATKSPYVIGAIFSTTGDNAPLGVPERQTAEMLEKQINAWGGIKGHPLKIEFYDDAGKPEQAVQACQRLLADKAVLAIIGPTLTGPSLAIAGMCNNAGMPLISCAASVKIVSPVKPYVFKTAQTDSLAVDKLIDYCKSHKISRVAFINDSNAFGASGRDQWKDLASRAGINTVAWESFGSSDTDMTAQLTKIRAAKPQAIVCWGTNPGPAIVAKDAKMLGLKLPLLMSHGIANSEFLRLAGTAADGVVFPSGKIIVAKDIPASDPQKKVLLKYRFGFSKDVRQAGDPFRRTRVGRGRDCLGGHKQGRAEPREDQADHREHSELRGNRRCVQHESSRPQRSRQERICYDQNRKWQVDVDGSSRQRPESRRSKVGNARSEGECSSRGSHPDPGKAAADRSRGVMGDRYWVREGTRCQVMGDRCREGIAPFQYPHRLTPECVVPAA